MSLTEQGRALAERCADSYSADRYSSWAAVATALLRHGLTEREAEAVLRSKWTRWAGDTHGGKYGRIPAKAVIDFVQKQLAGEVQKLAREHWGE